MIFCMVFRGVLSAVMTNAYLTVFQQNHILYLTSMSFLFKTYMPMTHLGANKTFNITQKRSKNQIKKKSFYDRQ